VQDRINTHWFISLRLSSLVDSETRRDLHEGIILGQIGGGANTAITATIGFTCNVRWHPSFSFQVLPSRRA